MRPDTPIANIWAVGRNYADHAKELSNAVPDSKSEPMIFLKAGTSIVRSGGEFHLPAFSNDIHHECEIALRFGDGGNFEQISIALDLTARDIQNRLKSQGHPWTLAKSFRDACPLGPLVSLSPKIELQNIRFKFSINGEIKQFGFTGDMIHPIEKLRLYVLEHFPVVPGDLLLTGTPVGVGPVKAGDVCEAEIEGILKAKWTASRA
jgi:2-keto-4-pentenoate hydratase/2-oxohepta-3-ene-1,7-dioic acid hydratase in catechol pathway